MTEGPPATNSNPKPITVKQEWLTIAIAAALTIVVELCGYLFDPVAYRQDRLNVFNIVGGLIWWLGQGVWLSMDRRRRGLEMGRWRYGVLFFGVLAICLYLALEYRARALYLIPLTLAVYVAIVMVYEVILLMVRQVA